MASRYMPMKAGLVFENGSLLDSLDIEEFRIELYSLPGDPTLDHSPSHYAVGFRLFDQNELIFERRDLLIPHGVAPASYRVYEEVLAWSSIKPGDADDDFFTDYTAKQLKWCATRADELSIIHTTVAEMIAEAEGSNEGAPLVWSCRDWGTGGHRYLNCPTCRLAFECFQLGRMSAVEATFPKASPPAPTRIVRLEALGQRRKRCIVRL